MTNGAASFTYGAPAPSVTYADPTMVQTGSSMTYAAPHAAASQSAVQAYNLSTQPSYVVLAPSGAVASAKGGLSAPSPVAEATTDVRVVDTSGDSDSESESDSAITHEADLKKPSRKLFSKKGGKCCC